MATQPKFNNKNEIGVSVDPILPPLTPPAKGEN
jgi:hypothetical protein